MADDKKKNEKPRLSENTGYSWFAFDCTDWLTSLDVQKMTASERGVYITLLPIQWQDNYLPSDMHLLAKRTGFDRRLLGRWFANHGHLFPKSPANPQHLANPKLWNLAVLVGKIAPPGNAKETTSNETKLEESTTTTLPPSAGVCSCTSSSNISDNLNGKEPPSESPSEPEPKVPPVQSESAPHSAPPPSGLQGASPSDPRQWSREVAGVSAERIRNCVVYQLEHKPNKWYFDNLTTAALGRKVFVTKLDEDTPRGWTPEQAMQPQTALSPESSFWMKQLQEKSNEC